jgi:uncharacterized protein with NRDE domain
MCLILFAHQLRSDLPLVLLANRDEYLARATAPLAPWAEEPAVVGGRDLEAGGSWLGVGADGRWAAVTNVREGEASLPGAPSRGWLVRDFLLGRNPPEAFIAGIAPRMETYAGFNLLLGDGSEVWWVSNREAIPVRLPPGLYGLSNGRLDSPWPKVERGKAALRALLAGPLPTAEAGFRLLADRETCPDHHLPATGISLAWERSLSPVFIVAPEHGYGTRSSTVLLRAATGETQVAERSFAGSPEHWSQRSCQLAAGETSLDY